jgi:hypothetical protein
MRDYLSASNLWKAISLGAFVTLMSVPRIVYWGVDLTIYIPAVFFSMTLTSGAATAWSTRGGMYGLFPAKPRMITGIGTGLLLALLITPAYVLLVDPILVESMKTAGKTGMVNLRYPPTLSGRVALVMWIASFETVFFRAGTISFLSRVTGNKSLAVVGAVCFRTLVSAAQLSDLNLSRGETSLVLIIGAVASSVSSVLFIETGLPGTMIFSAVLCLHVFLR